MSDMNELLREAATKPTSDHARRIAIRLGLEKKEHEDE